MCTGIRIMAENGAVIYARTMEFGIETKSNIIVIPRNYTFTGTAPSKNFAGLHWKSKYAVIGANMLNIIGVIDGVNEKGLAGGLFYFPDFAQYQHVSEQEYSYSIASWELLTWILTNFSTVAEVKQHLPTIKVTNTVFSSWGIVPPIHAIVHDLFGESLVIEYVKGELHLHDNPIAVITNAPTFDWHVTNLSNYINLSPFNIEHLQLKGLTLSPLGQGSGLLGLPGDFTSPSRFVRATVFMQTVQDTNTEHEAINAAFHILNLFDIPFGSVIEKNVDYQTYEITQWTSAVDLKNKRYFWHTHENRQIYAVDLMKMNLNGYMPLMIKMNSKQTITDITPNQ